MLFYKCINKYTDKTFALFIAISFSFFCCKSSDKLLIVCNIINNKLLMIVVSFISNLHSIKDIPAGCPSSARLTRMHRWHNGPINKVFDQLNLPFIYSCNQFVDIHQHHQSLVCHARLYDIVFFRKISTKFSSNCCRVIDMQKTKLQMDEKILNGMVQILE